MMFVEVFSGNIECLLNRDREKTRLILMDTPIFAGMMNKGLIRKDDPAMLAFAYTAPISALIHLCDREPDKVDEALAKVEAFSRHFIKTYGAIS